jgi:hypothetical protein
MYANNHTLKSVVSQRRFSWVPGDAAPFSPVRHSRYTKPAKKSFLEALVMAHCVNPEEAAILDKEFPVLDKGIARELAELNKRLAGGGSVLIGKALERFEEKLHR